MQVGRRVRGVAAPPPASKRTKTSPLLQLVSTFPVSFCRRRSSHHNSSPFVTRVICPCLSAMPPPRPAPRRLRCERISQPLQRSPPPQPLLRGQSQLFVPPRPRRYRRRGCGGASKRPRRASRRLRCLYLALAALMSPAIVSPAHSPTARCLLLLFNTPTALPYPAPRKRRASSLFHHNLRHAPATRDNAAEHPTRPALPGPAGPSPRRRVSGRRGTRGSSARSPPPAYSNEWAPLGAARAATGVGAPARRAAQTASSSGTAGRAGPAESWGTATAVGWPRGPLRGSAQLSQSTQGAARSRRRAGRGAAGWTRANIGRAGETKRIQSAA